MIEETWSLPSLMGADVEIDIREDYGIGLRVSYEGGVYARTRKDEHWRTVLA